MVPPTRLGALAENGDRNFLGLRFGIEQFFFGQAAVVPERLELAARRFCVPFAARRRATVWASARSMLSPPSRMCSPTATRSSAVRRLLGDGDQREIGGAAADIDDQHEVALA